MFQYFIRLQNVSETYVYISENCIGLFQQIRKNGASRLECGDNRTGIRSGFRDYDSRIEKRLGLTIDTTKIYLI
jgi:hypothetical protein